MAAPSGAVASGLAVRRLRRDLENLQEAHNPQIAVQPSGENLLEWHFVLHSLPADTPYHGGCYHGKILFPPEYPHAPPAILMVTPSGRLEIDCRLCLSMTDFHPESWNPAWSVETILVGLLSFFISDAEKGFGAISASEERRRQLAVESRATNAKDVDFQTLFPEFLSANQGEMALDGTSLHRPPDETAATVVAVSMLSTERGPSMEVPCAVAAASLASASPSFKRDAAASPVPPDDGGSSVIVELGDVPLLSSSGHTGDERELENRGEAAVDGTSDEETPQECWICRDTDTTESLIQPCACRGSMSSVHASCVEQWIRHHRQNAVNDAVPCCSVCHQPYCGQDVSPGVGGFVRHLCSDAAQQLLRTVVLVFLLVGYQGAAEGPTEGLEMPTSLRVVFITLFTVATLHKVLVLTVSLPPHRPPPDNQNIRRFFISDHRKLAMHIAEAFATITILAFWCACGSLSLVFFLPIIGAGFLPVIKIFCLRHPSLTCVSNCLLTSLGLLLSPLIVTGYLIRYVWQHPRQAMHPLDAGLHIIVAVIAGPMCLIVESNVSLVILWTLHSLVVGVGLAEQVLIKRWEWKEGNSWWFALQLTAFSAYIANALCEFPKGFGEPHNTNNVVMCVSTLWLGLVCALTLRINWALVVRYYRTWQHRHGNFTLQVEGGADDSSRGRELPAHDGAAV